LLVCPCVFARIKSPGLVDYFSRNNFSIGAVLSLTASIVMLVPMILYHFVGVKLPSFSCVLFIIPQLLNGLALSMYSPSTPRYHVKRLDELDNPEEPLWQFWALCFSTSTIGVALAFIPYLFCRDNVSILTFIMISVSCLFCFLSLVARQVEPSITSLQGDVSEFSCCQVASSLFSILKIDWSCLGISNLLSDLACEIVLALFLVCIAEALLILPAIHIEDDEMLAPIVGFAAVIIPLSFLWGAMLMMEDTDDYDESVGAKGFKTWLLGAFMIIGSICIIVLLRPLESVWIIVAPVFFVLLMISLTLILYCCFCSAFSVAELLRFHVKTRVNSHLIFLSYILISTLLNLKPQTVLSVVIYTSVVPLGLMLLKLLLQKCS
jgi:hypothetical protein